MIVQAIVGQLKRHGFVLVLDGDVPNCVPIKANAVLPDDLLEVLKKNREEIVEWMTPKPPPEEELLADKYGWLRPDSLEEWTAFDEAMDSIIAWNNRFKKGPDDGLDIRPTERPANKSRSRRRKVGGNEFDFSASN